MQLAEFHRVMDAHTELLLPSTAQLFANAHTAVHKRHDLPFAVVNGCLVPDERMIEGDVRDGVVYEWTYEHMTELRVMDLQVGLRKELRKRVTEQGCQVVVHVLEGGMVKESACLHKTNNFSCTWYAFYACLCVLCM
jgi:hypothetical protein